MCVWLTLEIGASHRITLNSPRDARIQGSIPIQTHAVRKKWHIDNDNTVQTLNICKRCLSFQLVKRGISDSSNNFFSYGHPTSLPSTSCQVSYPTSLNVTLSPSYPIKSHGRTASLIYKEKLRNFVAIRLLHECGQIFLFPLYQITS